MENQDFTLPYNNEAERAVLGALLLESNSFYEVNTTLSANMFYSVAHQTIYQTIEKMHRESIPVDMITITQELIKNKTLDTVGGAFYIADLTSNIASSVHIVKHSLYIKQEFLKRDFLRIIQDAQRMVLNNNDIDQAIASLSLSVSKLEEGATNTDTLKHIQDFAKEAIRQTLQRSDNFRNGKKNGITSGLKELDRINGGWQNGELIVIAGRPAMGKTALSIKLLEASAMSGDDVAMFALEMKGERLVDRIILEKTGIEDWRYKSGGLTNEEIQRVESTSNELFSMPVYIDDNSSQRISQIKSKCRLLKKKGRLKLIIIDYLQLTEGEGDTFNREQEISKISREAKKMAKALDVPVIMLSQLNRAVESRADKRPLLSDLRESGAIEQDADMVMFIHRPEYYGQKLTLDNTEIPNGIELIIAKYREGATGSVFVQHDGSVRNITDYNPNRPTTPF